MSLNPIVVALALGLLVASGVAVAAAPVGFVHDPASTEAACVASGYNASVCSLTNLLCHLQPSALVCAVLQ